VGAAAAVGILSCAAVGAAALSAASLGALSIVVSAGAAGGSADVGGTEGGGSDGGGEGAGGSGSGSCTGEVVPATPYRGVPAAHRRIKPNAAAALAAHAGAGCADLPVTADIAATDAAGPSAAAATVAVAAASEEEEVVAMTALAMCSAWQGTQWRVPIAKAHTTAPGG